MKPSAEPQSGQAPVDDEPLVISELHLCRTVHGFGSFEPLPEPSVRAGQRALIYCEMSGLKYEQHDDSFLARIASRIELRSAGDGTVRWEHDLGSDQDECRHRRRDFYVNYLVDLPATLAPGPYRLKLLQTNLVANRSAATETPIEIAPGVSAPENTRR